MSLIIFLVVGLIAGFLASYIMGRQQDLLVNLLIGAAHRYRQRLGLAGSLWSLVGIFVGGRLIPVGRPPRPS